VTSLIVGALSLFLSLATYAFSDDHFGRITPGRQIARYGELPFRDFFDPGYFLTELASAAAQRVFGDNLFGEMLLTSSCVAAGAVLILWLVRRATGSLWLGIVTAGFAVLAFRRQYDYDKFLFYPLGPVRLLALRRHAPRARSGHHGCGGGCRRTVPVRQRSLHRAQRSGCGRGAASQRAVVAGPARWTVF
jgi:hypothetical protein